MPLKMEKTFIIIPCYNEEKRIGQTLEKINELTFYCRVIVVDDGSEDKTFLSVKNNFKDVIALRHTINLGKGAALKTGCDAALMLGADIFVFIDADGQHSPEAIPKIVKKMRREGLDLVFASRKMKIGKMPLLFFMGNKLLTFITAALSNVWMSDSQSGFRALRASAYKKIRWEANDYSVENEIIMNAGKNNLKYGEIFVETIYKDNYKGTTPFDGVNIIMRIIKNKLSL